MEAFNIDTLEYKVKVKVEGWQGLEQFISELESKKMFAQETRQKDIVYINGQAFEVYASGQSGEYAYHLSNDRFHLYFRKFDTLRDEQIKIKVDQYTLWNDGAYQSVQQMRENLESLGLEILSERPSRVDLCCHTDSFNLTDKKLRNIVTRATKSNDYFKQYELHELATNNWTRHKEKESIYWGKGEPILLRIYNKTNDCEQKGKQWFYELWREMGLDTSKPIFNIEYQCRSEALKEMGLYTVDNVFTNLKELWSYLTTKWFSFRIPSNYRHTERRNFTREWKRIINAGSGFDVTPLVREKKTEASVEALTPALAGYITTIGKLLNAQSEADLQIKLNNVINNYFEQKGQSKMDVIAKKIALAGQN